MNIYHIHHIIPKHEWKRIRGNLEGWNVKSNKVKLTIENHAEEHRKLFEQYGRWQDELAWLFLSKQITYAQAIKDAQILSNKTRIISDITRQKMSESQKGRVSNFKGKKHTQDAKNKMSLLKKGKKQKESTKKLWSKNRKQKFKNGIMYVPSFQGMYHTNEHKQKMSQIMSGRKLSEETKLKISLAKKRK